MMEKTATKKCQATGYWREPWVSCGHLFFRSSRGPADWEANTVIRKAGGQTYRARRPSTLWTHQFLMLCLWASCCLSPHHAPSPPIMLCLTPHAPCLRIMHHPHLMLLSLHHAVSPCIMLHLSTSCSVSPNICSVSPHHALSLAAQATADSTVSYTTKWGLVTQQFVSVGLGVGGGEKKDRLKMVAHVLQGCPWCLVRQNNNMEMVNTLYRTSQIPLVGGGGGGAVISRHFPGTRSGGIILDAWPAWPPHLTPWSSAAFWCEMDWKEGESESGVVREVLHGCADCLGEVARRVWHCSQRGTLCFHGGRSRRVVLSEKCHVAVLIVRFSCRACHCVGGRTLPSHVPDPVAHGSRGAKVF